MEALTLTDASACGGNGASTGEACVCVLVESPLQAGREGSWTTQAAPRLCPVWEGGLPGSLPLTPHPLGGQGLVCLLTAVSLGLKPRKCLVNLCPLNG